MGTLEFGGLTIEFSYLLWSCPACGHGNRSPDASLTQAACAECGAIWTECPSDDCYADGPDCQVCGGQSGGLVRVTEDPAS